jgi:RHS repeat-associated protein
VTDSDGDGIPDICDNCPSVSNSTQKDVNKLTPEGLACEPSNDCTWKLVEQPIYGMAREGVAVPDSISLTTLAPDSIFTRKIGQKLYELDDHLGNARVIISDRKLSDIVSGVPGNFRAEMKSYTNLYPFGMEQPGRYMNGDAYRYGYNGMEQDSSIADDQYTTYFRMYDARLGRWMSIDPVTHVGESPYVAMNNSPIIVVDPSGASGVRPNSSGTGDDPAPSGDGGNDPGPGGSTEGTQRSDATSVAPNNSTLPPPYIRPWEGMYSSDGAVGGGEGYWHNDPDGSSGYMPADVYKGMVEGFIDKQFLWGESFTPEDAGFRSSDLSSFGFQQLYAAATKPYETAGPYVHGRWNPYFKGHQLYDNNGDILMAVDFGIGIWKLGAGATRYIVSRSASRGVAEWGAVTGEVRASEGTIVAPLSGAPRELSIVRYDARFAAAQMGLDPEKFANLPVLRQQYVTAVYGLRYQAQVMRAVGNSVEDIARAIHAERRVIGIRFKDLTPPDMLEAIYARNIERYGDKLGPTIEWLRGRGKSWEEIIESASRAGGSDLGF